jgi:hypothetical protein
MFALFDVTSLLVASGWGLYPSGGPIVRFSLPLLVPVLSLCTLLCHLTCPSACGRFHWRQQVMSEQWLIIYFMFASAIVWAGKPLVPGSSEFQ